MNILERTLISVLAAGPVPQHIGFVMDGNRRFARRMNREIKEGHHEGYRTLVRVSVCPFLSALLLGGLAGGGLVVG
jgi:ditrans,polycis-polyprenyl diphosphate synthase